MMMHVKIEDFDDAQMMPHDVSFDPAFDAPSPSPIYHCVPMTEAAAPMTTAGHDKHTTARLVSDHEHALPHLVTPPSQDEAAVTGRYSSIEHGYHIDPQVLGTGHHGSVRQCVDRSTGRRCAVKSIRKSEPTVKPAGLQREIALLEEMRHENVIELIDVFEDSEYVHLVTDLCAGGELFDRIVDRSAADNGAPCFTEQEAASVLRQILEALAHLHERNVVHRDMKPENVLFETSEAGSRVKLIDLGLSRKHHSNESPMSTVAGTPYYIAPEVLQKRYSKSCDLWSVGVIAYILLCGYPPFNGGNAKQTHKSVLRGRYCFPIEDWKDVDPEAMDFIHRLLKMDPRRRMTAGQALNHPWILKHTAVNTEVSRSSNKEEGRQPKRSDTRPSLERQHAHGSILHSSLVYSGMPRSPGRRCGQSPPRRKLRVSTFGL